MSWKPYTVRFSAVRPRFMSPIGEPDIVGKQLAEALDWMEPVIDVGSDTYSVQLTMPAPSAEGALHHVRGSFRSTLYATEVPAIGNWPLASLDVSATEA